MFILGISFFLASLTVYFIDTENIWLFGVRLLWLATPIFYAVEGQKRLYYVNLLNPMYYLITSARDIVIYAKLPDVLIIFGTILYPLIFFIVGWVLFNIFKNKFAERI